MKYYFSLNHKNEIKDVFEENLEWDIHLYKNAIIPIITNNEVKDVFPNKKGESSVVLLLSKIIRENISNLNLKEDDIIYFEKEEFNKLSNDIEELNLRCFHLQQNEKYKEIKKKSWWSF
mgnify:CR=1 FL=1